MSLQGGHVSRHAFLRSLYRAKKRYRDNTRGTAFCVLSDFDDLRCRLLVFIAQTGEVVPTERVF